MRVGVASVLHPGGALRVVALGELPNPLGRVAGDCRHRDGGVSLAEQPEDLPPGTLIRIVRAPIALLELNDAQMGVKMKMSSHAAILQHLFPIPYHSVPTDSSLFQWSSATGG
jgi:hypothetical protein